MSTRLFGYSPASFVSFSFLVFRLSLFFLQFLFSCYSLPTHPVAYLDPGEFADTVDRKLSRSADPATGTRPRPLVRVSPTPWVKTPALYEFADRPCYLLHSTRTGQLKSQLQLQQPCCCGRRGKVPREWTKHPNPFATLQRTNWCSHVSEDNQPSFISRRGTCKANRTDKKIRL